MANEEDESPLEEGLREGPREETTSALAEPTAFATIIKADLTGLSGLQPADDSGIQEAASSINEFLGALSTLLASVGSGDAGAARDAATALQLELFGGPSALDATRESGAEAQERMLDDLLSLIRFARLGDLSSAEASAHLLARHLQTALLAPARLPATLEQFPGRKRKARTAGVQEPASLVQGATAAYELLMDPDPSANAA